MRIFDADATCERLPFDRLIPALRRMFASNCTVPQRHVHQVGSVANGQITSLLMPAWLAGRYFGVKTVNIAAGNAARGLPGLHATYFLYDAETGVPLALIDGSQITTRRTAAASALAASMLAAPDARHLLIVGAGQVAAVLPEAYRTVLPVERVSVWARSMDRAEALAARLRSQGFEAAASCDLELSVNDADIVSCATLSTTPLIHGHWLKPGCHLDLIGGFTPEMREVDDDCFEGAAIYVDTDEALTKSGDLLGPLSRGVFAVESVRGTLESLVRGTVTGRSDARERTVFKSVGTALEDLAAAIEVLEGASQP